MSPCAFTSYLHNWLTNSPHCTSYCVKVAATQLRRQGCCYHLTHSEPSPDVYNSWRAVRAARLPWKGRGWLAELATVSFTALVHTLSITTMNSPRRLKKWRKWSKHVDNVKSNSLDKTAWDSSYSFYKHQHGDVDSSGWPLPQESEVHVLSWMAKESYTGYNPGFTRILNWAEENWAYGNFNTLRFWYVQMKEISLELSWAAHQVH